MSWSSLYFRLNFQKNQKLLSDEVNKDEDTDEDEIKERDFSRYFNQSPMLTEFSCHELYLDTCISCTLRSVQTNASATAILLSCSQ